MPRARNPHPPHPHGAAAGRVIRHLLQLVGSLSVFMGLAARAQTTRPATASVTPRPLTTAEIAARTAPATVTIITLDADGDSLEQGSGFVVRCDGLIVTNWHVIRGALRINVILADGRQFKSADLLDQDSVRDVALLHVAGYDLPTVPVRFTVPAVGEHVVAIGSPRGLSQTVSDGIVAARRQDDGRELAQITAPVSPGSSGGAVLDNTGAAFALSTSYVEQGQSLNFAVPVRYALNLLGTGTGTRFISGLAASADEQEQFGLGGTVHVSSADTIPRHKRTTAPAASMVWTYLGAQNWQESHTGVWHVDWVEIHMSASGHTGLLIVRPIGANDSSYVSDADWGALARSYAIDAFTTDATGNVLLRAGGLVYHGYQATLGYLVARTTIHDSTGEARRVYLDAYRPGVASHFYRARCRIGRVGVDQRNQHNGATEWRGEIVVSDDIPGFIAMSMYLQDAAGAVWRWSGNGRVALDGSYTVSSGGVRISGYDNVHNLGVPELDVEAGTAEVRDERAPGPPLIGTLIIEAPHGPLSQ